MLKVIPAPAKFTTDVNISVPGQDEPVVVKMTFRYLGRKEQSALTEKYKDSDSQAEALSEVLLGWEGFDVEYSKENLETFLDNYRAAEFEIWRAYFKGLTESKVKN